jgi:hypothetical protein
VWLDVDEQKVCFVFVTTTAGTTENNKEQVNGQQCRIVCFV